MGGNEDYTRRPLFSYVLFLIFEYMINQQTLELYVYVDGINDVPFLSNDYQEYILSNGEQFVTSDGKVFNVRILNENIIIHAFTYNAKRMGSAPTITATIKYPECLDELFSQKVYATFNGEKYFLVATPSSSYSNDEIMYKHEATFVSERIALENTYYYDVVAEDYEGDEPVSNNSDFVLNCDIHEFAKRMNYSLNYAGLDYTVIVDDGISSDEKFMAIENKFFSEVLQEVYNTYDLPYYFVGKEIHIGYSTNAISEVFRYGDSDALVSITKSNANNRIINRATGIGSEENIPYYYPNVSPEGDIRVKLADTNSKLTNVSNVIIKDYEKFAKNVIVNQDVELFSAKQLVITPFDFYGYFQDRERKITVTEQNTLKNVVKTTSKGENTTYQVLFNIQNIDPAYSTRGNWEDSDDSSEWLPEGISWKEIGDIRPSGVVPFLRVIGCEENEEYLSKINIGKPKLYWAINEYNADAYGYSFDNVKYEELKYNDEHEYFEFPNFNEALDFNREYPYGDGMGYCSIKFEWDVTAPIAEYELEIGFEFYDLNAQVWKSNGNVVKLENIGIEIIGDVNFGDKFQKILIENSWIKPQPTLMPPIYRESLGAERFYDAISGIHIIPDENGLDSGLTYEFENEYNGHNPKEQIVQFEEIKPTIKEMRNSEGLRIDMFSDIAFDENDNDEMYEATDGTMKYKHPLFFAKLRKLDFNLFDSAIDGGEMTFAMTDGSCGACKFKVAVDKDSKRNTVQVDENGDLVRYSNLDDPNDERNGDVICGDEDRQTEVKEQDKQQDTINNEVWIALYKDKDTFGEIMPSKQNNLVPKACSTPTENDGDTFVILNISLPQAYIKYAEKQLEQQIIYFIYDNNREKFNFSVKFSRIYFAEHPEILSSLDENSRITVEYNGVETQLYVSSITYKTTENDILPEITVELKDEVTVTQNQVQKATNQLKSELYRSLYGIDVVAQGTRVFLRKDQPDTALQPITFKSNTNLDGGATVDKKIESKDYFEGSKGLSIRKDENGQWHIETDYLNARKKFTAKEVDIQKVYHISGAQIKSSASMICSRVADLGDSYRCWFDTNDDDGNIIYNQFVVGDQAYVQTFNLIDDGYGNTTNHFYWRLVTAVDANSITLSKTICADGSTAPMVGDNIVQLGYQGTDRPERQVAVIDAGAGEGAPYYRQYVGIDSFEWPDAETQLKPNDNVLTGRVTIKEGSILSGAVEVYDNDVVVAGINGSDTDSNYAMDDDTLMIFAGANGVENAKNANFRVTKSGKVVAKEANIEGVVYATSGTFDNGEFTNAKVSGEVNAKKGTFSNGTFENVTINGSVSSPFDKFVGTQLDVYDSQNEENVTFYRDASLDTTNQLQKKYYAWKDESLFVVYTDTLNIVPLFSTFYKKSGSLFIQISYLEVIDINNKLIGENGIDKKDNLAILANDTKNIYSDDELSWTPDNSGRIVRLVNAPYEGTENTKYITLIAPSGRYFIEDGERYSRLNFSNEIIELIGYGTSNNFYGWIVLNRKSVNTTYSYGSNAPILYQGVIENEVIQAIWTPQHSHSERVEGITEGFMTISDSKVYIKPLNYRGLDNTRNWTVIVSGANVVSKGYDATTDLIYFELSSLSGYVTFQVISTADWLHLQ